MDEVNSVDSLGNVRVSVDSEYCDNICFDGELVECSVYPLSNKKVFKGVNHHTLEEVTVIVKGRTGCFDVGLGETKPYYCKGDYIWLDENGNITSKNQQEFKKELL